MHINYFYGINWTEGFEVQQLIMETKMYAFLCFKLIYNSNMPWSLTHQTAESGRS